MITKCIRLLASFLIVVFDFGCGELSSQVPGERPPGEVVRRVQPALEEGQRALEAQDAVAVRAAVAKAISVLGPWAGNPETATRYYPPIVSTPFDAAKAREWWLAEVERGKRGSIFSVIERVFGRGRNRAQPIIRKGWLTDVVYWFTTIHPGMNPRGAIDKP